MTYVIIAVVVVACVGYGFYLYKNHKTNTDTSISDPGVQETPDNTK